MYTKFGLNKSFHSQDIEKYNSNVNQGRNSVASLRKITIYNPNVDLVSDYVYTKFGHNKSVRSQDIEKMNSNINQRP